MLWVSETSLATSSNKTINTPQALMDLAQQQLANLTEYNAEQALVKYSTYEEYMFIYTI